MAESLSKSDKAPAREKNTGGGGKNSGKTLIFRGRDKRDKGLGFQTENRIAGEQELKPLHIIGVLALGIALGVGGTYLHSRTDHGAVTPYAVKAPEVPQDGHYSRLDYQVIDAKGLSRLQIESFFDGCTGACSKDEPERCERGCSCFVNEIVRNMSKEEVTYVLFTMGTEKEPIRRVKDRQEQAMQKCKSVAR